MSQWLAALNRLLQDPTGNTAALAAAIGIAVLLVLVLVLVLLAFAIPGAATSADETPEQAERRRAARRRARLSAAGVVFFASLAATIVWYQSTSTVRYCTRVCHQMAEPAETWRASSHANVACIRCHEGRPWISFPQGLAARVKSLYLYAADKKGDGGDVADAICIDCHRGLLDEEVTALNGETYVHREDYDEGRECSGCHGAQGHEPPVNR